MKCYKHTSLHANLSLKRTHSTSILSINALITEPHRWKKNYFIYTTIELYLMYRVCSPKSHMVLVLFIHTFYYPIYLSCFPASSPVQWKWRTFWWWCSRHWKIQLQKSTVTSLSSSIFHVVTLANQQNCFNHGTISLEESSSTEKGSPCVVTHCCRFKKPNILFNVQHHKWKAIHLLILRWQQRSQETSQTNGQ